MFELFEVPHAIDLLGGAMYAGLAQGARVRLESEDGVAEHEYLVLGWQTKIELKQRNTRTTTFALEKLCI